ncbi:MAG: filamentous hemagglutinin N-terminal domain-containing protein [Proteobacteria bacterium]|nr:filamentous hemagglutinin N-terminal domain-containing protein [Pseudomonadota bacterium]
MKLKPHLIQAKVADYGIRSGSGGYPLTSAFKANASIPKKTAISCALTYATSANFYQRLLLPLLSCSLPGLVFAAPEGGQVVAGSASISNPDANTTLITQTSSRTAIDWQRFNIGSQEYVQFAQPDTNSVALNRVVGGDPSLILGNLSANGQVFLVNPNGVYFGQNTTVDVGGIVASVRDISNDDFMSGNYVFSKTLGAADDVGIVNDGTITARDGGYVVMMGDYVRNNGIISARMGTVALASGNQLTMDVKSNGLVSVAVDEKTFSRLAGIDNAGQIMANGGRVMMTAKVANDLIDTAINNEGLVVANSIAEHDGVIFLTASGGDIVNTGRLDASAEDGSNADGGGVLVYSDKNVKLITGSEISARGDGAGAGGAVRVIAEEQLDFQSEASIKVHSDTGKGGFVEVSGHGGLALRGSIDVGTGGSLLIDPDKLFINSGGSAPGVVTSSTYSVGKTFIENQLLTNNVILVADTLITSSGSFGITATGAAVGDLSIINGTIASGGSLGGPSSGAQCNTMGVCINAGVGGPFSVNKSSTGDISLPNIRFKLNGALTVSGGTATGSVSLGAIDAGGNVNVTAGSNITFTGKISAAGTSLQATAGGDINISSSGGIASSAAPLNADVTLNAGNSININGDVFLANNSLLLNADADGDGAGDVLIEGSTFNPVKIETQGALKVSGNNFVVRDISTGSGTGGSVSVKADTVDVTVNNNVLIQAGSVAPGFPTSTTANASLTATKNIVINATSLNVSGGRAIASLSFGSSPMKVDANATLEAGGDLTINLSGGLNVTAGSANATMGISASGTPTITANANAVVKAGGDLNVNVDSIQMNTGSAATNPPGSPATLIASAKSQLQGNNINLETANAITAKGGEVTAANALSATAGTDITASNTRFDAGAIYMSAAGNIDLTTSIINVGSGTVAGISGDKVTLAYLASQGIPLPTTANPNAKFSAAGAINLGDVTMQGGVPYLWLEADSSNMQSLSAPSASSVIVQYSPYTVSKTIGVEAVPDTGQSVNYNNVDHFNVLDSIPSATIIVGSSAQKGDITIGDVGKVDIGSKNMVVVTASKVTSIDNVISTGIVAELLIDNIITEEVFVTPVLTEVEVDIKPVEDTEDEKKKRKDLITNDEAAILMCEAG